MSYVFKNEEVRARLHALLEQIRALEKEAVALADEDDNTTRFLTDEQREELVNYFSEQAADSGDRDDSIEKYMDTGYFNIGQSDWTDYDLLKEFVINFPDDEPYNVHKLWKETLSHNLAAVAAAVQVMEERDAKA